MKLLTIDPASLRRGQRKGRRCALPNCRRLFLHRGSRIQIGRLPDRRPVFVCEDCAATFALYEPLKRIAA